MIRFGGSDTNSIKFLESFPRGLFISELVNNSDKRIHDFLQTQFTKVLGKRSTEEMQDFRNFCNGALDNVSDDDVAEIIQFYVLRIKNYAHLESMYQGGLKEARIIPLEVPRTAVCESYEAKTISVKNAFEIIQWFKTLSHAEYYRQISNKDFGIPPLYRNCRCRFQAVIAGANFTYKRYSPNL